MKHRAIVVCAAAVGAVAIMFPASAAPRAGSPRHATHCITSSTTASRYNTTPKGHGPWQVPLDPCNSEGQGNASTPYYNCAYWAAEKRPDLWANAVLKYGYDVAPGGAWNIEVDARRAGYRISHRPRVGDIAAWPDNATIGHTRRGRTFTASPGGHVAYVQRVRASRITISTMGVSNHGGKTETITFNRHKTYFIHHKHT